MARAHRDVVEPERRRRSPPGTGTFSGTSRSPSTRSRPRAASARRTSSPSTDDRRRRARDRCSSRPAARRSASRRFASDDTLALGAHTITVTQASAAATKTGGTALGGLDRHRRHQRHAATRHQRQRRPRSRSRTARTPRAQLAHAVQDAATSAGAPLTASLDRRGHALARDDARRQRRRRCRSPAATRSARCQLSTDGAALTGIDGKVQVDGGADADVLRASTPARRVTLNARGRHDHRDALGRPAHRHAHRQQREHRRRQPRDRRRQDQRRQRRRDRDRGAGRRSTSTACSSRRTPPARNNDENIAASAFNANVGGFVDADRRGRRAAHGRRPAPARTRVTSATNTVSGLLPGRHGHPEAADDRPGDGHRQPRRRRASPTRCRRSSTPRTRCRRRSPR